MPDVSTGYTTAVAPGLDLPEALPRVPPPRLTWIEPTRGLAILLVVLYHTFGYLRRASSFHGEAGVDAFLLLSGFGLAYGTRAEPWHHFLWRRLKRLLPAYWIVLALCVLDLNAHDAHLGWAQFILHATCLHLIPGEPYSFAISNSFWFLGLIVPLYVWFAMLRPWMLRDQGYAALGVSLAVASVGGVLLMLHAKDAWGLPPWGHVPHRMPQFFIGAVVGLAFGRRETLDRFTREPLLLLGVVVTAAVVVYFDWANVPFFILAGTAIIALGIIISILGERYRIARPLLIAFTVIGGLAYEWYLCHQYLLADVGPRLLLPKLAVWLPRQTRTGRQILCAVAMIVLALWVAWGIRWLVAWRENRRTWRVVVPALACISVLAIGMGVVIPGRMMKVKPRTFRLDIQPPAGAANVEFKEPIIAFGVTGSADIVFLEHDGHGLARFRIDHWGDPTVYTAWTPIGQLLGGPVDVTITTDFIRVQAGGQTAQTELSPHIPNAKPLIGKNEFGLTDFEPVAKSRITRLAP